VIDPDKYIVFKRSDLDSILSRVTGDSDGGDHWNTIPEDVMRQQVTDAVVIRLQDVFAPAVLSNYAHQIDLALKLSPDMPKEQRRNLTDLSLYFQNLSLRAEEQQSTKLPTL
jgi:hypothetical protein